MRRPSPAFLLALIALMVALSGTTYAATQINGSQITKGSITASKLSPSLRKAIARPGPRGLRGPRGFTGAVGPAGPTGQAGFNGLPGPAGTIDLDKIRVVEGPEITIFPGEVLTARADCAAGERALGGGYFSSIAHPGGNLAGFSSWALIASNDTSIPVGVSAYVVCVGR